MKTLQGENQPLEPGDSQCDMLRALVSGTFGEIYICELEDAHKHWSSCDHCRESLPQAANHLKFIEGELLRRVRVNIERLHHRYSAAQHSILAKQASEELLSPSSTTNFLKSPQPLDAMLCLSQEPIAAQRDENTERILLLEKAGQAVQAQLEVMNDNCGLDYFHLLHTDSEYASTHCDPFIASLPYEIQLFIFQSILALDSLEGCGSEVVTLMGSRLYTLVSHAARAIATKFGEDYKPASYTDVEVRGPDRDRLLHLCENIERNLEDVADSLKAGQMEILRSWKQSGARAADMERYLAEQLGPLYKKLSENTRRALQLAEYHYSHNLEPDDYAPAIIYFHRAYETEFKERVWILLEARLRRDGHHNYGSGEGSKRKLMNGGNLSDTLTLGQVLWYIRHDSLVSTFVTDLGLDANKLCERASRLNTARNGAVHEGSSGRDDAERVRNILCGPTSIFADLFSGAGC